MTAAPIYHTYSTPSPLSAHKKYLMSYLENGTWDIVDVATTRVVFHRNPGTQSYFWDANDDEVYYYVYGAAIYKQDLRTNKTSVLIDYSKEPEQFHEIVRGATGDTSRDNWISFWAPDDKTVCALDIDHLKTYCADYADSQRNLAYGDVDFTLISKGIDRTSGKRYVMLVAPPAMGIFSVDLANSALKLEYRGPEGVEKPGNNDGVCDPGELCLVGSHLDTLEDSAGIQYLVENDATNVPCEVSLSTFQLNTGLNLLKPVELGGGRKKVMTLWRCGPGWVDEHVGCAKVRAVLRHLHAVLCAAPGRQVGVCAYAARRRNHRHARQRVGNPPPRADPHRLLYQCRRGQLLGRPPRRDFERRVCRCVGFQFRGNRQAARDLDRNRVRSQDDRPRQMIDCPRRHVWHQINRPGASG